MQPASHKSYYGPTSKPQVILRPDYYTFPSEKVKSRPDETSYQQLDPSNTSHYSPQDSFSLVNLNRSLHLSSISLPTKPKNTQAFRSVTCISTTNALVPPVELIAGIRPRSADHVNNPGLDAVQPIIMLLASLHDAGMPC